MGNQIYFASAFSFFIPESGGFGGVHEGLLKFALIRFFDGSGLLLAGKTTVVVG